MNKDIIIPKIMRRFPDPIMTSNPSMQNLNPNQQFRRVIYTGRKNKTRQKDRYTDNPFPGALDGKYPMTIVNPTYDQFIVKPPKENVSQGRMPFLEFISSSDRNFTLYPKTSNFKINLKDEYKNVTSVTLFDGMIPNTAFIVGKRNNLIYFRESFNQQLVAEIPVGDYTNSSDLATSIQTELNNVGDSNYTVTVDTLTSKFTISSDLSGGDNIFSLNFYGGSEKLGLGETRAQYPKRSIGIIIGYPRKEFNLAQGTVTLTAGSTLIIGDNKTRFLEDFEAGDSFFSDDCNEIYTVVSVESNDQLTIATPASCSVTHACLNLGTHRAPNKFDLNLDPFVILDIRELRNNIKSNSSSADDSFAIIPMPSPPGSKNYFGNTTISRPFYRKYFNPPLARLDRFTIEIRDNNGNIINFNGIDNFFNFRIKTMNGPGIYDPGVAV